MNQNFEILKLEEVIKQLDELSTWKELHIHHTWKPRKSDFTGKNHISLQKSMYNYHVHTKKWDDIAQHYSLFPDGRFVNGRELNKMPISIYGRNKIGALAIEMIGNFDKGEDKLDGKQKESILYIAKYFYDKDLPIIFHREYSPKTCPGSGIDKKIFIQEVANIQTKYFKDFEEVPNWAKDDILLAHELGIVKGDNLGFLYPNKPITKAEAIAMIIRAIRNLNLLRKED